MARSRLALAGLALVSSLVWSPPQAKAQTAIDSVDWDSLCDNFKAKTQSMGSEEKSTLGSACLVYLKGLQRGIHNMVAEGAETKAVNSICDQATKSAASSGDLAWLERHLQSSTYTAVQKLKIIQACGHYKEGYQSGLIYAKSLFAK